VLGVSSLSFVVLLLPSRLPDRLGARTLLPYSLSRWRWKLGRGLGKTVPENGLATTTVLGDVPGGGVGESVRKSGWM
jgi:hypothetical protein